MRILLTGACGYVGSALLPKLEAAGHVVTGMDTMWFREDIRSRHVDLRAIDWRTFDMECDAIIHLAAISNDPSVSYYCRRSWETTALATQQMAQWAQKRGARFIYASSVSVYGADRGLVVETDDVYPISDYNRCKQVAERVLLSYPEIRPQIIRPATICGLSPRMRLDLTVNMLTMQALTCKGMTVHGGSQWRPSIHIDDMCALYLFMLDHPELTGVWNAGFENNTILDIASTVREATGAALHVTAQRDARSYQVNSDKLLATGFRPSKTVKDAIAELMAAHAEGTLRDLPQWYNLGWMQHLGVKDE